MFFLQRVASFIRRMAYRLVMAVKDLSSLTSLVVEEIQGYLHVGFRKEVYEKVNILNLLYSQVKGIRGDEGEMDEDMPEDVGYNREAISRMVVMECGYKVMTREFLDKRYEMEEKGKEREKAIEEQMLEGLEDETPVFNRGYGPEFNDKLIGVVLNKMDDVLTGMLEDRGVKGELREKLVEYDEKYSVMSREGKEKEARRLIGNFPLDDFEKRLVEALQPDLTKSLAFHLNGVFSNVRASVLKRVSKEQKRLSPHDEPHIDPAFKTHTELPGDVTLTEVDKYVDKYYDKAHQMVFENAVSKKPLSQDAMVEEIKKETGKEVAQKTIDNWTESIMKDLHNRFFSKLKREKKLDVKGMNLPSLSSEELKEFEGYVERHYREKLEQKGLKGRTVKEESLVKMKKLINDLAKKVPPVQIAEEMGITRKSLDYYISENLKKLYSEWQKSKAGEETKKASQIDNELERVMSIIAGYEDTRMAREAVRKALGHVIPVEPEDYDSLEFKGLAGAVIDYDQVDRPVDYDKYAVVTQVRKPEEVEEEWLKKNVKPDKSKVVSPKVVPPSKSLTPEEIERNREELIKKYTDPSGHTEDMIDDAMDTLTEKEIRNKVKVSDFRDMTKKWITMRILNPGKYMVIPQFNVDYDWDTAVTMHKKPEKEKDGTWVNDDPHFKWVAYHGRIGKKGGEPFALKRGTATYSVRFDYSQKLNADGSVAGKPESKFLLEKEGGKGGKEVIFNEQGASDFKAFLDDYFTNLREKYGVVVQKGKDVPVIYEWVDGSKVVKDYHGTDTFEDLLGGLGISDPKHKEIAKDYDAFVEKREKHQIGRGWLGIGKKEKETIANDMLNRLRNIRRNEKATKEEKNKAEKFITLLRHSDNVKEIDLNNVKRFIDDYDSRLTQERKKKHVPGWDEEEAVVAPTKREEVTTEKGTL